MRQSSFTTSKIKFNKFLVSLKTFALITLISLLTSNHVAKGQSKEKISTPKRVKKVKRYGDSFFSTTIENKPRTEKELNLILSGLNALLPVERSAAKKNEMLISKSITLLSLGKHYYLNDKLPNAKQKKEKYLKLSMQAAGEASNSTLATQILKAKAFHVYGMAALYVDNEAKAVEYFEQSIKADPKSKLSPRLSVFIGEYYFDQEKYEAALPYYSQFFNSLTHEEMALALYKSAWCYFNLKQYENSEKSFIKIAGKKWAGDYGKDAIRDLAQVVTSYKIESEILQFGVAFFNNAQPETLIEFYTNCYMIMLRQSGNKELASIYNEIQRLEKRPEKRVLLAIKKLSVHQKGYAASQVFKDIIEIDSIIIGANLKPDMELFKFFASDLEVELLRSISSYVDTISKKVKTPENYTDIDIANKLQRLLWYHVAWFPNSPKINQTYMLALDNCLFLKDSECSLKMSRIILRQENLKSVWPRARVEVVLALERLSLKDTKYKQEFEKELKIFADTQTKEKEWLPFTKKLTAIYITDKKYIEVEPYLIQILNKENNSENLYRKIFCQYNLKKNIEVVKHLKQIPTSGPNSKEIKFLIRESSLNLAKEYNDKSDFNNYEKFLFQYLGLDPEPEKADLVMADYLNKLLAKQDFAKVISYYTKLTTSKKFEGVLSKPFEQLLIHLFSMNRFQESSDLLSKGSLFGQYRNFDFFWLRTLMGMNGNLNLKEYKILSTAQEEIRLNFLSLASVTQPELAVQYFKSFPPVSENEKKIWLLSMQMIHGDRQLELTNYETKYLSSILNNDIYPPQSLKSEKLIKLIEFPQPQWNQARIEKVTPDAIERVKSVRSQIVKDIKGQNTQIQKRLILNGIAVEKKMAWFFDESPIPKGLTKEEIKEYKEQIETFTQEYYLQVQEYEKMLAVLASKDDELSNRNLPVPKNIDLWNRDKIPSLLLADTEFKRGHPFRSLVILEAQKDIGKLKIDEFYRWRSFVILNKFPHNFAAEYMQEELTAYKQDIVMNEWSKLVGYSVNDRTTASEVKK